ncbi:thermonuclease family protein [Roseovarius amoyensis]|uniref:thermonuclease family protein n=1 Tax=Roseovarius amoyensis TaxID=2211448 RepID=UPI000DBE6E5E|nr:hypothetical protein [Roseovarius amoyensis]
MMFLLGPGRNSFIGRVISSIRSALLVGLALAAVPYVNAIYQPSERAASASAGQPEALRGGGAWGGLRPVSRNEGAELAGKRLSGPVTHVRDGDTVEVRGVPVRIANLDCAELGTPAGRMASEAMTQLARTGPLTCRLTGRQSYDREVGTCAMPDGRDIGAELIAKGVCSRWR